MGHIGVRSRRLALPDVSPCPKCMGRPQGQIAMIRGSLE